MSTTVVILVIAAAVIIGAQVLARHADRRAGHNHYWETAWDYWSDRVLLLVGVFVCTSVVLSIQDDPADSGWYDVIFLGLLSPYIFWAIGRRWHATANAWATERGIRSGRLVRTVKHYDTGGMVEMVEDAETHRRRLAFEDEQAERKRRQASGPWF